MDGGQYLHCGLMLALQSCAMALPRSVDTLVYNLNVDGFSTEKNSAKSNYAYQGMVISPIPLPAFVISLYRGPTKPRANMFSHPVVWEMNCLKVILPL